MAQQPGFFAALFDFSFTEFITTRVVKVLYALAVFFCGILALGWILGAFAKDAAAGLLAIILAPLAFLLYVLAARVWLEVILILFRIAEHTKEIVATVRKQPEAETQEAPSES